MTKRLALATISTLIVSASFGSFNTSAQTPTPKSAVAAVAPTVSKPKPPAVVPATLATCLAMLNDVGPHVKAAKLNGPEMADLQLKA